MIYLTSKERYEHAVSEVRRIVHKVMLIPADKFVDFNTSPRVAFAPTHEDCVEIVMLCEDTFHIDIDDVAMTLYFSCTSEKTLYEFVNFIISLVGINAKQPGPMIYHADTVNPKKDEQMPEVKQIPVEIVYEQSVWLNAVKDAEANVMRNLPVLSGGRVGGEDILEYRDRCLAGLDAAVKRFVYAEKKYKEANARAAEADSACAEAPAVRKRKSKKQ